MWVMCVHVYVCWPCPLEHICPCTCPGECMWKLEENVMLDIPFIILYPLFIFQWDRSFIEFEIHHLGFAFCQWTLLIHTFLLFNVVVIDTHSLGFLWHWEFELKPSCFAIALTDQVISPALNICLFWNLIKLTRSVCFSISGFLCSIYQFWDWSCWGIC